MQRLLSAEEEQTQDILEMLFSVRHRFERWPNIETASGECLVCAGSCAQTIGYNDTLKMISAT